MGGDRAALPWQAQVDVVSVYHGNGSGTLTGVNDADDQPPFLFTGTLNTLTLKLDRPQLSAADIQRLEAAMRTQAVSE